MAKKKFKHPRWISAVATLLTIADAYKTGLIDKPMARKTINNILRCYGHYIQSSRIPDLVSRYAQGNPKLKTVREHAVPVKVVAEHILSMQSADLNPTDENINNLAIEIQDCIIVVRITKDEDACLSRLGLTEKMPKGWQWGDSYRARYDEAGIEIR